MESLKASSNLKIIAIVILAILSAYQKYEAMKYTAAYQKQQRQLNGYLSAEETALTAQQKKFNLLASKLKKDKKELKAEADELREKYGVVSSEFEEFRSQHNIEIDQYQKSVHSLRSTVRSLKERPPKIITQQVAGSCTEDSVVSYTYEEHYGRVKLEVPNCLKSGEEILTLDQSFVVYGEVYRQEDGILKVSSVKLTEVSPSDPKVILGSAKLVDSTFSYNPQLDYKPKPKVFSISSGLAVDNRFKPAFSISYLFYKIYGYNFGTGLNVSSDFEWYPTLKLVYRPTYLGTSINIGFTAGFGYDFLNSNALGLLGIEFFIW